MVLLQLLHVGHAAASTPIAIVAGMALVLLGVAMVVRGRYE